MSKNKLFTLLFIVFLFAGQNTAYCKSRNQTRLIKDVRIIQENAGYGSWDPTGQFIVFDKINDDFFYDIYIMRSEGNIVQSITEGNPKINQRHNGWPVWHPGGKFIVFQSEEEEHLRKSDRYITNPGMGFFNNLWAATVTGKSFWKLTNIPVKKKAFDRIPAMSIVHPLFSKDGSKLLWTERYSGGGYLNWGMWQIKTADFIIDTAGPRIDPPNGKVVLRAEDIDKNCNYVVGMGFSPDGKKILIAGNLTGQHVYGMDQYIYNLRTGKLSNLLNTPKVWEEGSSWSPDGKKIVYMSNINSPYTLDFNNPNWRDQPNTREYWIMNADGSNKQQLTFFNQEGSLEYQKTGKGKRVIVAVCSFSPDGKKLIGTIGIDQNQSNTAKTRLNLGIIELK